jgi:hypothetical protein
MVELSVGEVSGLIAAGVFVCMLSSVLPEVYNSMLTTIWIN